MAASLHPPRKLRTRLALSVALAVITLAALRTMQLLSVAPLLHDPEFLQFARLAQDLASGRTDLLLDPLELFPHYTYMAFAQGTVVVGVVTWLLSPLLGVSSWSLQASSLLAEALAVGLLAALLVVSTTGRLRIVAGLAPWLLAPGFAVIWQMLPFGNHTELLWVPIGIALFLAWRPPEQRAWWHWWLPLALLTWGVFCYRGTIIAIGALVLCGIWSRSKRFALGGLVVAGVAMAILTVMLLWLYGDLVLERPGHVLLALRTESTLGSAAPLIGDEPFTFPTAPRDLPQWPYLSLLLLGLFLALVSCRNPARIQVTPALHARRFVALWALLAFGAALLDTYHREPHCLPALYALLVCAAMSQTDGVSKPLQGAGAVILALLAIAGARDGLATIHPSVWSRTLGYEGVTLHQQLDLRSLDLDDLPWFQRIVEQGRANPHVGVATHSFCTHELRERTGLPHPQPHVSVCGCERPGELGGILQRFIEGPPHAEPSEVGRGVWIFCNRDMDAVHNALEGLPEPIRDEMLAGARKEQAASGTR